MPELDFEVKSVKSAERGLAPLLHFKVSINSKPPAQPIHTVLLHAQIQIECPQRSYNSAEKQKLVELFGRPEQWGRTLRNRLWGFSNTTVPGFTGSSQATLSLPCTLDMNVAATKYFTALDGGEVPLLFLFTGTIFYEGENGRLQVRQISWNKECVYRMPIQVWRDMMEQHFPNSAWLFLQRDLFDRLNAYKRQKNYATLEEAIAGLLAEDPQWEMAV